MAQDNLPHVYTIGDVVRITESFGPNQAGSLGIVYETYPNQDTQALDLVSVLLTNGHDIGSFNGEEQIESLQYIGHVPLMYAYSSPDQLMTDYRRGYFDGAFPEARSLAENPTIAHADHQ